ncbi:MAG: DUF1579 domain-containing protein [Ginsengibacter sp.]
MKLTGLICCLAFFISCSDNIKPADTTVKTDSTTSPADTMVKAPASAQAPMDSVAMMKAWQAYMTPGQVHAMLAKSNGTWKADITIWMSPGAPPTKSTSTAVNKMVLGGRYQESHHTGSFNGMPFEGLSMLAYDNAKKIFQSSWIDNMGTGITNMEGTWDSTFKTINFKGRTIDPGTGKDMDVREIFTIVDDNNQKMEMFANQGGKEMKTMEILFTRK